MKFHLPAPIWIAVPTFLLVFVMLGLFFGMPIYRHHRAICAIRERGGSFRTRDGSPRWLQRWVDAKSLKVFDEAWRMETYETVFDDGDAPYLAELKELEGLALVNVQISDAGVANLQGLARLTWLRLNGTDVTDEGIRRLSGLTNLMFLDVRDTRVTDAGIADLNRALPALQVRR
jgi:hypothetical protein